MRKRPHHQSNESAKDHRQFTKQGVIAAILSARSLNRYEAELYGHHCLNSTVSTLRRLGYEVHDQWETVSTPFGKPTTVKRYRVLRGPGA